MGYPATRLRRLRSNGQLRALVAETRLSADQLVLPLFVVPGDGVRKPVPSLLGVFQLSIDEMLKEAQGALAEGVKSLLLFGVPQASSKDERATEATKRDGLVPRAVEALKEKFPQLLVMTDVCLCAYTSHGHCGLLDEKGRIMNDASLEILSSMAVAHAEAGADLVAPSDMMDGRIAAIRRTLDGHRFSELPIMSYAAKYASSFYGPFRDAAHSAPSFGDRKSYQMDIRNCREALREIQLDLEEGADIVMVKPATPCLDIIAKARARFEAPIAAYQVSGEYAMIKAAAEKGWVDGDAIMLETLTAIRRAGADIIFTYAARDLARVLE